MILLIRHCTPNINYTKCSYKQVLDRLHEYNNTYDIKLTEISDIKDDIQNFVDITSIKVFCSSSPRAIRTATHLFPEKSDITKSNMFVEFDLSIFYIPFLKCTVRIWFFISRILWFIGFAKANRNFLQERKRAKSCAKLLLSESKTSDVALVAHGLLNSFIEKHLQKNGWRKIHSSSSGCFSIKILDFAGD